MTAIDIMQWLGETSLAVSLLILLVLVLRKPFTKAFGARAAYALWLAPAARLFLPELKILPAPAAPEPLLWTTPPAMADPLAAQAGAVGSAPPFDLASLAAATALVVWALVAFAWFNIKLEAQARFMRTMTSRSKPAPQPIMRRAQDVARQFGLKRAPRIRICEDQTGPCVVGLVRPVIFLPAAFETNFTERERHLALAHEIAHIARGDMAATLAGIVLQSAQWPNPLAHFAFKKFRTDQEAACDAFVLARCMIGNNAAGEYAAAIMKSVRAGTGAPAYGLSLAHPVKERLMLLKNQKNSPARVFAGAASAIALVAAGLGATASYGYAAEESADDDKRVVKRQFTQKSIITADSDETMEIEGVTNPAKIEYENDSGVRTVKIYDKRGRLIFENVYEDGEDLPFKEIVIHSGDGAVKKINLDRPAAPPRPPRPPAIAVMGLTDDEHDFAFNVLVDDDVEFVEPFAFADGVREPHMLFYGETSSDCLVSEDGEGPVVYEWRSDDDADGEHTLTRTHEIICLSDESADPEKRAEMLKNAIDRMEKTAQREAERRERMIAKMREELQELEKNN